MTDLDIIVVVLPALMIVGAILAPVLAGRRPPRNRTGTLPESGGAVDARPIGQQIPVQLVEAGSPEESASGTGERDQYLTDWTALQKKFGG